ncbi:MAG: DNA helicase [Chloroflexi bacterium]|nr:DNA helicase [Chloroflexota bacterium]
MPIRFTERFARQYARLPGAIQRKVDKALRSLDADFRYPGLRSHPMESAPGVFEAYVDIKYRMTFERHSNTYIMRNVDNHDECLKNP